MHTHGIFLCGVAGYKQHTHPPNTQLSDTHTHTPAQHMALRHTHTHPAQHTAVRHTHTRHTALRHTDTHTILCFVNNHSLFYSIPSANWVTYIKHKNTLLGFFSLNLPPCNMGLPICFLTPSCGSSSSGVGKCSTKSTVVPLAKLTYSYYLW